MLKAKCKQCGMPIKHNGEYWSHIGSIKPRHIAAPHDTKDVLEFNAVPDIESLKFDDPDYPIKIKIIDGEISKSEKKMLIHIISENHRKFKYFPVSGEWINSKYLENKYQIMEKEISEECITFVIKGL